MSAIAPTLSPGLLSRERTIAHAGFNRWLVPPAALAVHLCIGVAYAFSVFWLPLSKAVGISKALTCPADASFASYLTTTSCDWKLTHLGWTFTLFFVFLGSSAALFGGWLERVGPRKAGIAATLCWCGGLLIAALAVAWHQLWLLWLGLGVIGGIGLGLGYISPVSTLIKWFPDRRGMATGLAIMGFGGGAMIGAPLADKLMKHFAGPAGVGVWQTFAALAAVYFVFMLCGSFGYRVPPDDWRPAGWTEPTKARSLVTHGNVSLEAAWRSRQFWLVWGVLCLNVTAGIGVLGMASPLLQEVFGGRLIGLTTSFDQLTKDQLGQVAAIAAGFTGLLSLFNIAGRIFWASLSDRIGRKSTYALFFIIGLVLYSAIPWLASSAALALFVASFCIILSMYGGGFATVPAYLADLFGTKMVGAIHGRLLTAWSAAGIFGPVLVNYIREYELAHGVAKAQAYSITMFILAGLLAVGLVLNWLIRPVPDSLYLPGGAESGGGPKPAAAQAIGAGSHPLLITLAWAAVWLPIAWGVYMTLQKAVLLF
jgi:MFS family permease